MRANGSDRRRPAAYTPAGDKDAKKEQFHPLAATSWGAGGQSGMRPTVSRSSVFPNFVIHVSHSIVSPFCGFALADPFGGGVRARALPRLLHAAEGDPWTR